MDLIESEGFRNQAMTAAAAARQTSAPREGRKRALVLQLDEREQLALELMGGAKALRELLAPTDLCLGCRAAPPLPTSQLAAFCADCVNRQPVTSQALSIAQNALK